jgi:DNA modification methylase
VTWTLHNEDALAYLRALPDTSPADAFVTSPPYADQRHYDGSGERATYNDLAARSSGALKNRSRKQRRQAIGEAVDFLEPFLVEMYRLCAPRGALMLNLGVVLRDGVDTDWGSAVLERAKAAGWVLLHRMFWNKPNANTLSDPRFLRIQHEDVFWLAKSPQAYRGYDDREEGYDRHTRTPHSPESVRRIAQPYVEASDRPGDERYAKRSRKHKLHPDGARPTTVITCGVGGVRGISHPAVMPLEVARQLVRLSCPPGGLVVDPFAGSGTTGRACLDTDRDFVGIEIVPEYAEEARRLLRDWSPMEAGLPYPETEQLALS